MIGILLLMAGLWGLGTVFRTPRRARLWAMAVLWAAVGLGLAALPAGARARGREVQAPPPGTPHEYPVSTL